MNAHRFQHRPTSIGLCWPARRGRVGQVPLWAVVALASCFVVVLTSVGVLAQGAAGKTAADGLKSEAFFGPAKVWSMHLIVSSEQWNKMEPTQWRMRGPGGGGRRPGGGGDALAGPGGVTAPEAAPNAEDEERFPWGQAVLECEGEKIGDIGVRFKGNSSFNAARDSLKRSLKLDFNRVDKGRSFQGLTQLNLNNNAMDPSQSREALAYAVFRAASVPASRTASVRLFLTVTGRFEHKYVGFYTAVEEVDERFLRSRFGAKRGLLLKPERAEGLPYLGPDWSAYTRIYRVKSKVDDRAALRLVEFTRLINEADDATFKQRLPDFLDLAEALRFLAVMGAVANLDSPLFTGHNFFLYLNPMGMKFSFIPWDLNEAFGGFFPGGSPLEQATLSVDQPFSDRCRLFRRMLAVPEWKDAYRSIVKGLLAGPLETSRILAGAEGVHVLISDAVREDGNVDWTAFESNRSTNMLPQVSTPAGHPGGSPRGGDDPPDSMRPPGLPGGPMRGPNMANRPALAWFLARRTASLTAQLEGRETGYVPRRMLGFGGPGGGPPGGPEGGFGGPGGERPGPGPGPALSHVLFEMGDTNRDERLSKAEFDAAWMSIYADCVPDTAQQLKDQPLQHWVLSHLPARPSGAMSPPPGTPPDSTGVRDQRPRPGSTADEPPARDRGTRRPPAFGAVLLKAGDADRDGALSRQEWTAFGHGNFEAWDADRDGFLTQRECAQGLNQLLMPVLPRRGGGQQPGPPLE